MKTLNQLWNEVVEGNKIIVSRQEQKAKENAEAIMESRMTSSFDKNGN